MSGASGHNLSRRGTGGLGLGQVQYARYLDREIESANDVCCASVVAGGRGRSPRSRLLARVVGSPSPPPRNCLRS
jgi:hypothetical protein